MAINSADDERNPPELGIREREIKRVKRGRYVLIPASEDARGHGTTGMARSRITFEVIDSLSTRIDDATRS